MRERQTDRHCVCVRERGRERERKRERERDEIIEDNRPNPYHLRAAEMEREYTQRQ